MRVINDRKLKTKKAIAKICFIKGSPLGIKLETIEFMRKMIKPRPGRIKSIIGLTNCSWPHGRE